jgi:hypothetical protein
VKVKIERPNAAKPTPPAESENAKTIVTDSIGRKLTIQQPSILWESRLVRAMGDAAMNAAYMTGYVLPAAMVVEIDGRYHPFPLSEIAIDGKIQLLGRHGLAAVMQYVTDAARQEDGEADLKKSDGAADSESLAGS